VNKVKYYFQCFDFGVFNLAWLNDRFKASAFAITKGLGNAADGAGASISFPTAEKAKPSH
jgi:hypothetical protein